MPRVEKPDGKTQRRDNVSCPTNDPHPRPGAERPKSYGTALSGSGKTAAPVWEEDAGIPPADYGAAAWLFLGGCFCLEAFIWALPFSYGVFENYYSRLEPFSSQPGVAAVGTTTLGIAYFLAPIAVLVLQRWPRFQKTSAVLGVVCLTTSLVAASFADSVSNLILTQGLLYGIGACLVYNPFIFWLDDWFIKRKGLAYGVFWAGSGVGGTVMPMLMNWALHTYGFRTTLRVWAVLTLVILSTLVYCMGPRRPPPAKRTTGLLNIGFLRQRAFWLFQIGNVIEGFGYFMPHIFMSDYATSIGFSPLTATASISLLNTAATVGMIFMGFLCDRLHVSTVLFISAIGSALSVFLLWGFAVVEPVLYMFAITYGIFAGGYTSTWTGCATEIRNKTPDAEVAVIMGILAAGRGFGCILSGPVGEMLVDSAMPQGTLKFAYGTKFGRLIMFTGVTALLGRFGLQAVRGGPLQVRGEETSLLEDET